MIRDEGVEEGEDVDKTKGREKCAAEQERGGEGPAPAGVAGVPGERGGQRDGGGEDEPRENVVRVGHDAGVNETEVEREEKFTEVKPDGATGEQETLGCGEGEVGSLGPDEGVFEGSRGDGGKCAAREPREKRERGAAEGDRAALPPREHEEGGREGGGDSF